eukprot:COSAG04_NODE_6273_length_1367_cov_1.526025_2_plen_91_part_00
MSGGIHRDITCRKCGNLTHHEIKELTNITFLNHGEVKNIEMLFLFLLEVAEEQVAAGADHNVCAGAGAGKTPRTPGGSVIRRVKMLFADV